MYSVVYFDLPNHVAAILNTVKLIHFYDLCDKHNNYVKYIEKCIAGNVCTFKLLTKHHFKVTKTNNFRLSSGCDTVAISFEERLIHGQLPSEIILAQSV